MKFSNTALIVVDMQNEFAHEEGVLFSEKSKEVIPGIKNLVEIFEQNQGFVVFTQDTHTEEQFENMDNYDEFDRWGEHCLEGSWGHQIVEELNPEDHTVVQKSTYDAFHKTNLDKYLESKGIQNVVTTGTLANVCVLHTASSAALNDYNTIVLEDLVGYIEESHREYALEHANWLFGKNLTKEDLVKQLH